MIEFLPLLLISSFRIFPFLQVINLVSGFRGDLSFEISVVVGVDENPVLLHRPRKSPQVQYLVLVLPMIERRKKRYFLVSEVENNVRE